MLLELSKRADIQDKIRKEIQEISGNSQEWSRYRPVYDDLNKMKYIDHVMKESQRLWPIAPNLFRMSVETDQYENIHIPKGVYRIFSEFSYI